MIVSEIANPGQDASSNEESFPLILACDTPEAELSDAINWIRTNSLDLQLQAAHRGVILFRGFPTKTDHDFDAFVEAFGLKNFPYKDSLSNAVRVNRTERVFTANEAPPEVTIFLHHEMAQTPVYPSRLFFFCEKPAESGGATSVCRSDVLFDQIKRHCPKFAQDCEDKGLRYTNVMPAETDPGSGMGRSWRGTLRAESPEEAERQLARLNYDWSWRPDGCLQATTPVLPAVRELSSGRKSFFNQLIAAFNGWKDSRNNPDDSIRFGDGTPLDRKAAEQATELAEELAVDLQWQQGDVALVDNFVAMHGRRSFQGTRKVLASLS